MSPTFELDELDRQLITLLQEDARPTNRDIAARLSSSEPTIRRRIDRLTAAGVIKIVAVASPFALGFPVMAILGLQIDRTRQKAIESALTAMAEVRFLGLTLGSYDAIIEVWFHSNDELLDFLTHRLSQIQGIQRIEAWQVLKLSKYDYDWGTQPAP
jgi:Lrp/AsnC family transcriptional regulator, regulator for asnA, asnC and gidA